MEATRVPVPASSPSHRVISVHFYHLPTLLHRNHAQMGTCTRTLPFGALHLEAIHGRHVASISGASLPLSKLKAPPELTM